MTIEIRVPQLPESVADATLVAWRKQPGESVSRDENLADLETDKVVLEVPAPHNGIIKEIRVASGTTVTSGQLLALIEETATAVGAAPIAASASLAAANEPVIAAATVTTPTVAAAVSAPATAAATATAPGGARLSPAARRMVEENRLDPARIPASGRDGRLTKSDVIGFLQQAPSAAPPMAPSTLAAPAAAPAPVAPVAPSGARSSTMPAVPAVSVDGGGRERRVPMTRLRQRVAERLVQAQATQALLTSFNEVDLKNVQELRSRYKSQFEKAQGAKLGFMSFFVKACVEALRRFPIVNANIAGNEIVYHDFYDIGVAVSTERGLLVPVIRDADRKSFGEIEQEISAYAARAREGTIGLEDLSGGTFTITNGGVFGSLMSTPIVNPPQSAILGMHKIQERPMVVDGAIVVRPMMYLALTYDHRLIDGREAVQFLVVVKECLEEPSRMLLGV
jgi:2-oxoglutarate dehydrogenase E2 component (dihydrolipoamide succinyltransferase)